MHSSAPEHHQGQSAAAGMTAKSDSKVGAAAGAKFGPSMNAKPAAKSNNKSDAKLAINSSTAPETQPLPITYPLSAITRHVANYIPNYVPKYVPNCITNHIANLNKHRGRTAAVMERSARCSYGRPDCYVPRVRAIRHAERFVTAGSFRFHRHFGRPTRGDQSNRSASRFYRTGTVFDSLSLCFTNASFTDASDPGFTSASARRQPIP